jgi:hypothetical protein
MSMTIYMSPPWDVMQRVIDALSGEAREALEDMAKDLEGAPAAGGVTVMMFPDCTARKSPLGDPAAHRGGRG